MTNGKWDNRTVRSQCYLPCFWKSGRGKWRRRNGACKDRSQCQRLLLCFGWIVSMQVFKKRKIRTWKTETGKRCFYVVNSLSGLTCLLKPLPQHLADEAAGEQRKEMRKALLKYYLLLLTFSALVSVGQSYKRKLSLWVTALPGPPLPSKQMRNSSLEEGLARNTGSDTKWATHLSAPGPSGCYHCQVKKKVWDKDSGLMWNGSFFFISINSSLPRGR